MFQEKRLPCPAAVYAQSTLTWFKCPLLLLLRRLFQFRVGALVVSLKDRGVGIVVLLTQSLCFLVKRFGEIDTASSLVGFSQAVVDVSRVGVTFDVRLEGRNRFF